MGGKRVDIFRGKIFSRIYEPGQRGSVDIWPLKLVALLFIIFTFHQVNKYPILRFDIIIFSEVAFLIYVILSFILLKNKLSLEAQLLSLSLDFLFIVFFDHQSLSVFGYSSRTYILYIIPVIYCSYWFRGVFTVFFVTITSIVYIALNLYIPDMHVFYKTDERLLKLWPVTAIFYLVAIGIIFYKKKFFKNERPEQKKQEEKLNQLKETTRNLLKDQIDGYIEIDEDGKITGVNKLAWELLGYSERRIKKINVSYLYSKDEASRIMRLMKKSPEGRIYNIKSAMRNKEKEEIPILVSASFLHDETPNLKNALKKGKRFPSIGYFRDIRAEVIVEDVARKITQIANIKELLDDIVEKIARTINSETCCVFTYNEEKNLIESISSFGISKNERETYTENKGITAEVFFSNSLINLRDIDVKKQEPKGVNMAWEIAGEFAKNSHFKDFKHFLGTPLIIQEDVCGVIRVLNKYQNNSKLDLKGFTDTDEWLLKRIADQVSILLEKIQNKERSEALSKVGMELNEKVDVELDELLQNITKQVVTGMKIKACYLRLLDHGNKLKMKACYGIKGNYQDEKYTLIIGQGISGKVAALRKPIIVKDLENEQDLQFKEVRDVEKLKSMASIPLKYRSKVIGVINCYQGRKHCFTEQEIQIMETFAAFAAVAIRNKERTDELIALSEIGRDLLNPYKFEELLAIILEKAKKISGADRLCIKKYDKRSNTISIIRALNCDWYDKHIDFVYELGEDRISEVARTGVPYIDNNFDSEKKGFPGVPEKKLLRNIRSRMIIPIKIFGNVYGMLTLDSHRENFFSEDDRLISNAFSILAAIAIKNTNFFKKLHAVTETLPRITELDLDIRKVLHKIADTAAQVLETDILVLYRYDEMEKHVINPPIYSGQMLYPQYMKTDAKSFQAPIVLINKGKNEYAPEAEKSLIMMPLWQEGEAKNPLGRFVTREKIVSSAGILLKVGQETVGIMFINYRTKHEFNQDERRIIDIFASYIAIAIQNVMHFQAKEAATERVLQAERLASLGKTASFVAHSARNDLGAIQIYVNQIEKDISKRKIVELKPLLDRVQYNLKNVNTSFCDLLDITKQPELIKKSVFFAKDFKEKFKDFETEARAYHLQFTVKLEDQLLPIALDHRKMTQVFTNLFKNSLEAAPKGGDIIMEVKINTLDNLLTINWENEGEQIPEPERKKIFDIFYSSKESWGLGLPYCKRIIEAHNGKIYVDPEFNKGTRFVIEIPLQV